MAKVDDPVISDVPLGAGGQQPFVPLEGSAGTIFNETTAFLDRFNQENVRRREKVKRAREQLQLSRVENDLSRAASDLLTESQANAPADAPGLEGFADRSTGDLRNQFRDILRGVPEEVPEDILLAAQQRAGNLLAKFEIQQTLFENQSSVKALLKEVDDQKSDIVLQAFRNPNESNFLRSNLDRLFDTAQDTLEIPEKEIKEDKEKAMEELAINTIRGYGMTDDQEQLQLTLERLQDGEWDDDIKDAGKIRQLELELKTAIKSGSRAEFSEWKTMLQDDLESRRRTGGGVPGVKERLLATAPDDRTAAEIAAAYESADRFHTASEALKVANPAEQMAILESTAPKQGDPHFLIHARDHDQLVATQQNILNMRDKDPAAAAMMNDAVAARMAGALDALQSAPNSPEAKQDYQSALRIRLDEQEAQGVREPRIMSKSEAAQRVFAIEDAALEDRGAAVLAVREFFGDDLYLPAMQELVDAGLSENSQVLAVVAGQPTTVQKVAQVIRMGSSEIAKNLDNLQVRDVKNKVLGELEPWIQSMAAGDPSGGRIPRINGLVSVIQDYAVLKLSEGREIQDAATEAVNEIIMNNFTLQYEEGPYGDKLVVPNTLEGKVINHPKIAFTVNRMKRAQNIRDFNPVPFGSIDPGVPVEVLRERTLQSAINNGYFVTDGTGSRGIMMVPFEGGGFLPLQNKDGEFYQFDFLEASETPMVGPDPTLGGDEANPLGP